jgi:hypothetical protein
VQEKMKSSKTAICLIAMLFASQTFANEVSTDLQTTCIQEQLNEHKEIKGHPLEAGDFTEYCKCETDYITRKATKQQLSKLSTKQDPSPPWLVRLKAKAPKICFEPKKQTTT